MCIQFEDNNLILYQIMNVLITGSAGFIGYHLSKKLLIDGYEVIGIDNLNDYCILDSKERNKILKSFDNYVFYNDDITKYKNIEKIFTKHTPKK